MPVCLDRMAPRRGVSLENSTGCVLIVGRLSFAQHKCLRPRSLRFVQMLRVSFSDLPLRLLYKPRPDHRIGLCYELGMTVER
jgi:hypothetical protein